MAPDHTDARLSRDIYNITRLNREVRAVLEGSFPTLWVQGEISNLARPASGHIYFSLKDQHSQVRCAMFRNRLRAPRFSLENGMEVLVRATVSLYEGRGEFQLIVEHIEPAGEGALQRAFEELKQRLHQAGMFADSHKQAIPAFPVTIGVITSASGAAVRDILQVLKRRYPLAGVIIYPVPVQGKAAAGKITAALQLAQARREVDLVILARGGGSLEDLWPFNEERVARAIFENTLPIVTGIGHEIDFTIADFVADQRAATPSAAAELVSPDVAELQNGLRHQAFILSRNMQQRLAGLSQALEQLERRLPHPAGTLQTLSQRVDDVSMRMQRAMQAVVTHKRTALWQISAEINRFNPLQLLALNAEKCQFLYTQLQHRLSHILEMAHSRTRNLARALHAVSPLATLERGYAIVTHGEPGHIVREAAALREGEIIHTRLGRGRIQSRVQKINPDNE